MSSESSNLPTQNVHESRTTNESRPRRSRRKKDDDHDPDRKDTIRATKAKDTDRKEEGQDPNIIHNKDNREKEPKRGSRRQRDKSVSSASAHLASSSSQARKRPKLEPATPDQSPAPTTVSVPGTTGPALLPFAATTNGVVAAPVPLYAHVHPLHTNPLSTQQQQPPSPLVNATAAVTAVTAVSAASAPTPSTPGPSPSGHSVPSHRHPALMPATRPIHANIPRPLPSSHPTPTPPPAASAPYPTMRPSAPPHHSPAAPPPSTAAQPPQRTSGQNFDPIRSAFDVSSSAPPAFSPPTHSISPRPNRASASPAIASIIDPPTTAAPSIYTPRPYASPVLGPPSQPSPAIPKPAPTPPQVPIQLQSQPTSPYAHRSPYAAPPPPAPGLELSQSTPPSANAVAATPSSAPVAPPSVPATATAPSPLAPSPLAPSPLAPSPPAPAPSIKPPPTLEPTPMDVDPEPPAPAPAVPKPTKKEVKASSGGVPASNATSPKPAKPAKDSAPPPLPQGSGLISNALFGLDGSAPTSEASQRRTPNIILHIPLQGDGNRIVNFARLAEEQYGFAALHPRLAAQKERLARVAAAGAALERSDKAGRGVSAGESADEDLTLDVDRDSEMDGEGALGAPARSNGPELTEGKKKRRKKKMEEYDRDDPFVDDSELAWQEQAAASKDGFFVYSGPLVPEGEKVQVERADGTIKRGRGRGRGSRGRAPVTAHHQVPLAAAIPISQETGLPLRGPGSRGGGTSRRGRVSKAARHQGDHEKSGSTTLTPGRGGGAAGRGGSTSTRGGRTPVELAPRPNLVPAPSGPNPATNLDGGRRY
ncbi:uncharacterized protein BP01DRAFT_63748 [Aspergillus saccharolyticus JOP 1030-1]|uniref:HPC2-domain-containing protein n=1 Tax=Aspergillus saccharolyticus JOP 1030-1 TaxID=1450539 RepID=A0A318ZC63_9EURO|nr:HPC2-domain-containing protein [Aspergillus saccharolyticus JOP 1030-1]PYH45006.1 HPC2-domain-containing protein [Aspergillus saccharolyticus JOP 1030-1]